MPLVQAASQVGCSWQKHLGTEFRGVRLQSRAAVLKTPKALQIRDFLMRHSQQRLIGHP